MYELRNLGFILYKRCESPLFFVFFQNSEVLRYDVTEAKNLNTHIIKANSVRSVSTPGPKSRK